MSFAIVGAVAAGVSAVGGAVKAIDGGIKAKKAKQAAEEAQMEIDKQKRAFENLDTSNPYANMENMFEDLTVNQQEAEFMKQQQMQQQANIMDTMRGAAGGSGIAALAQTLANQGSLDAQKAAVSIGKQEQANQMQQMGEAAAIQQMEREGDIMSRQMQHGKVTSLLGMAADEKSQHLAQQAQAQEQMWGGVSDFAGGLSDFGGAMGKIPKK